MLALGRLPAKAGAFAFSLLRYSRGHIRILDLARLQAASCECYESVKAQADRLMGKRRARTRLVGL